MNQGQDKMISVELTQVSFLNIYLVFLIYIIRWVNSIRIKMNEWTMLIRVSKD